MAEKGRQGKRSRLGYGSTYRKGNGHELGRKDKIGTVLGGQVWLVKPDKEAQAANPCIWMQAGVVEFKNCNNYYDCTTCKYDQGMAKKAEAGKQMSWQDAMRMRPALERICRHSLTKRIDRRQCAYDYECSRCDFDQFFEDVWATKTKTFPRESRRVKGFEVPTGYYFHNGHTWARIESGGYIRVGMDEFAMKLLGRVDNLSLPVIGKELEQEVVGWGLSRGGNTAVVRSPVDGVIMEVNSEVRENPGVAHEEPYGEGWMFVVRTPNIKASIKKLMGDAESEEWISSEVNTLERMVEEVAGPSAADGGYLTDDIYGTIPDLGWENLTSTFLKT